MTRLLLCNVAFPMSLIFIKMSWNLECLPILSVFEPSLWSCFIYQKEMTWMWWSKSSNFWRTYHLDRHTQLYIYTFGARQRLEWEGRRVVIICIFISWESWDTHYLLFPVQFIIHQLFIQPICNIKYLNWPVKVHAKSSMCPLFLFHPVGQSS